MYSYNLKKTFTIFIMLISLFLRSTVFVAYAYAQEGTTAPTEIPVPTDIPVSPTPEALTPTPTEIPTPPASPTPPLVPELPFAPTAPDVPTQGTQGTSPTVDIPNLDRPEVHRRLERKPKEDSVVVSENAPSVGVVADGNVGDTTVTTGNANSSASIVNDANTNLSSSTPLGNGGVNVENKTNGDSSTNTGSVSQSDNTTTTQNNSANVVNNLQETANTGNNSTSKNVGDSTIQTGTANTSGTIVNSINTNADGVQTFQFDVVDDHVGDIVLDLSSTANCTSGCGGQSQVTNSNNGSNSINTSSLDQTSETNTFQNNDATVENNMLLDSNSGGNHADKNTAGDSTITTDDANVNANILNLANNNIDGNVILAVVNVFGNLVGDIIMPDPNSNNICCANNANVQNSQNGNNSTNTANASLTNDETINQFNNAEIENNLTYSANTGGNDASKNTGGDVTIDTGKASVIAQTINIANMNLVGGNYWLVLVNEAGQWIGKIIGGDGSNVATSDNLAFEVDPTGVVTVANTNNGSESTNTGTVSQDTTNTVNQTNDAKIVNNVNLSANTGNNSTSKNTGGDNSITTGDATIVANIVNFVNNNIVGDGKLYVTVINVFGSWLGDFVGPGQQQETGPIAQEPGTGGSENTNTSGQNDTSGNNGTGSGNNANTVSQTNSSPTQTITRRIALAGKILGLSTSSNAEDEISESAGEADVPSQEVSVVDASTKRKIHINLAWSLLGLPLFAGYLVVRKRKASNGEN